MNQSRSTVIRRLPGWTLNLVISSDSVTSNYNMKTSLKLWAIAAAVALFTHWCKAQELPNGDLFVPMQKVDWKEIKMASAKTAPEPAAKSEPKAMPKAEPKSWWSDFSFTPFGALAHPGFGHPVWGAGLDVGYYLNRTVSIHVSSLSYETDHWGGPAIDETSLLFRADLIRDSRERFVGYILAGGDVGWSQFTDQETDKAFGVGAGVELRLSKNASIGVDSRIRAWFERDKDVLTRGFVSLRW